MTGSDGARARLDSFIHEPDMVLAPGAGAVVMAVGCASPAASMFHLTTHAAFKALLFLGAGAVIYACHHEQDIWKLGGLRRKMPLTYRAFVTGALALTGFPLLSGFFSKDSILAQAYLTNHPLFVLGIIVAMLTAFYMMRCVLVVFHDKSRSDPAKDAHEARLKLEKDFKIELDSMTNWGIWPVKPGTENEVDWDA